VWGLNKADVSDDVDPSPGLKELARLMSANAPHSEHEDVSIPKIEDEGQHHA
jgi:hypothetical protein